MNKKPPVEYVSKATLMKRQKVFSGNSKTKNQYNNVDEDQSTFLRETIDKNTTSNTNENNILVRNSLTPNPDFKVHATSKSDMEVLNKNTKNSIPKYIEVIDTSIFNTIESHKRKKKNRGSKGSDPCQSRESKRNELKRSKKKIFGNQKKLLNNLFIPKAEILDRKPNSRNFGSFKIDHEKMNEFTNGDEARKFLLNSKTEKYLNLLKKDISLSPSQNFFDTESTLKNIPKNVSRLNINNLSNKPTKLHMHTINTSNEELSKNKSFKNNAKERKLLSPDTISNNKSLRTSLVQNNHSKIKLSDCNLKTLAEKTNLNVNTFKSNRKLDKKTSMDKHLANTVTEPNNLSPSNDIHHEIMTKKKPKNYIKNDVIHTNSLTKLSSRSENDNKNRYIEDVRQSKEKSEKFYAVSDDRDRVIAEMSRKLIKYKKAYKELEKNISNLSKYQELEGKLLESTKKIKKLKIQGQYHIKRLEENFNNETSLKDKIKKLEIELACIKESYKTLMKVHQALERSKNETVTRIENEHKMSLMAYDEIKEKYDNNIKEKPSREVPSLEYSIKSDELRVSDDRGFREMD